VEFHVEHWHWWVLTLLFVVFIAFMRGSLFIWMTGSSAVVGTVVWLDPQTELISQLFLFTLITIAGVGVTRLFSKGKSVTEEQDEEQSNAMPRSFPLIGRVYTLETPIINGSGDITIKDSKWRIRGEDAKAGEQVRIIGVDGIDRSLFIVEKEEDS